jgi:hypothetical protein
MKYAFPMRSTDGTSVAAGVGTTASRRIADRAHREGIMKRYIIVSGLVATALLTLAPNASAQRWGRGATPRAGVCFYEDINFGGRYFCSPAGESTPSVPSGMNDRISSMRIFGNASVTLYRDPNYRGRSRVITSDVNDFRRLEFNDRLSSFSVDAGRFARGNVYNGQGSRLSYREAQSMVREAYQSVLLRDPDAGGLRSWTDQVMANNWTQRDLERAMRQSDEYRDLRRAQRR